jgi:hypothetical protein
MLRSLDFLSEARRPFGPSKMSTIVQAQCHRKSLSFPGLFEDRAFLVAW